MALTSDHASLPTPGTRTESTLITELVRETLEDCERLLAEAERTAAEVVVEAERDAAQIRRDAVRVNARLGDELVAEAEEKARQIRQEAEDNVARLVSTAKAKLAEAEQVAADWKIRQAEIDTRAAALDRRQETIHQAATVAAGIAERTIGDAERWAASRAARAEDEAVGVVGRAWRASSDLQVEMLAEAEDEARAVVDAAHLEADRLVATAEESAERARRGAANYAHGVLAAAVTGAVPPEREPAAQAQSGADRRWWRRAGSIAVVLVAVLFVQAHVVEPFQVSASSMSPAIDDGDRILVNKLATRWGAPGIGEIVVVDAPAPAGASGWSWPTPGERLVKRVVGEAGQTVEGRAGALWVDGEPLAEPYLADGVVTPPFPPTVVPKGAVFVIGDNRTASVDSRTFGPVPPDAIVGTAELVLWPPRSMGRP